jgi:hypothetical protein
VCLSIIKRKSQNIDEVIENGKDTFKTFIITNEELSFLAKEAYPESYIKYIKNEDWYTKEVKAIPEFKAAKNNKKKDNVQQVYEIIRDLSLEYFKVIDSNQV